MHYPFQNGLEGLCLLSVDAGSFTLALRAFTTSRNAGKWITRFAALEFRWQVSRPFSENKKGCPTLGFLRVGITKVSSSGF
jgi:hypothetical protein